MSQFICQNKEVLSLCVSLGGVLLTLAFGGVLNWRHKICLDYESRRDVAINILRDKFVQRTTAHYSDVADERRRKKTEVEEIYKRPEQQELIRELGRDLEAQNRVRSLFRGLSATSQVCFGCIWGFPDGFSSAGWSLLVLHFSASLFRSHSCGISTAASLAWSTGLSNRRASEFDRSRDPKRRVAV